MRKRSLLQGTAAAAVLAVTGQAFGSEKTVRFAYQDMPVPLRLVMESGEVEKATGY